MTGGFSSFPTASEEGSSNSQRFKGTARILGPAWSHLPTITVGLLGVQIFWSVEMSYASPYLLSLGLSKSSMAVVFVAGPMSGLIMQPLIGILADNSTSHFGRRRPYMLLGALICITAMLLLGFTRAVASVFTGWDNDANDTLTIWLAILSIYLIDFSINAVQAVDRALLVDTLPPATQASGNAWAARMLGLGSVVGFFVGNINLPKILPFLGHTQLQVLSVVVSFLLLAGHLIMAVSVKERVLLKSVDVDGKITRKTFTQELRDIWLNMRTLPRVIRQICLIQFFAWIAWFPVLFYSTIYVGDLYKRSASPSSTLDQGALDAEATRLGSRALFYSALLSLFINLALPLFVPESAASSRGPSPSSSRSPSVSSANPSWKSNGATRGFMAMVGRIRVPKRLQIHLATLWAVSHLVFACCMGATFFTHSVWGSTLIITVTGFSWAVTQWAPFSLLAEAILTSDNNDNNIDEIDDTAIRLTDTRTASAPHPRTSADQERQGLISAHHEEEDDEEHEHDNSRSSLMKSASAQVSRINLSEDLHAEEEDGYEMVDTVGTSGRLSARRNTSGESTPRVTGSGRQGGSLSSKAGIILGIHNIFIVIPQFLVTGFSAILFALFDPKQPALPSHHRPPVAPHPGPVGAVGNITAASEAALNAAKQVTDLTGLLIPRAEVAENANSNSVVYIFRIGGVAAAFAFVLSYRLSRELKKR
ncbi:major facilitator superfamily domain-containing protein [Crepidotus variabilis]|uniref:Major facilitator superfamily domain-containing protein n=1 Tax=Crepidotus variabilis TaxID=179855 RepID=A0A9P6JLL3_9AGAR|nr:major facilitator superfamily domain-containing protein [Crepidotus variabilis]